MISKESEEALKAWKSELIAEKEQLASKEEELKQAYNIASYKVTIAASAEGYISRAKAKIFDEKILNPLQEALILAEEKLKEFGEIKSERYTHLSALIDEMNNRGI